MPGDCPGVDTFFHLSRRSLSININSAVFYDGLPGGVFDVLIYICHGWNPPVFWSIIHNPVITGSSWYDMAVVRDIMGALFIRLFVRPCMAAVDTVDALVGGIPLD